MASQPEWISISDAHDAVALRYFEHVDAEWMGAYNAAFQSIRPKLADGRLPSRPKPGAAFALTLRNANGRVSKRIDLEEGRIPALFWEFFAEAERASRGRLVTLPAENHTDVVGDSFKFHCANLVDRQTMDGFVESVEVLRPALELWAAIAPKKIGAPKGIRSPYNARILHEAITEIENGVSRCVAKLRFVPRLKSQSDAASKKMFDRYVPTDI